MISFARQVLRQKPFHTFLERERDLVEIPRETFQSIQQENNPEEINPEDCRKHPKKLKGRRRNATSKSIKSRSFDNIITNNEVRTSSHRWCVVCSKYVRNGDRNPMVGHTMH